MDQFGTHQCTELPEGSPVSISLITGENGSGSTVRWGRRSKGVYLIKFCPFCGADLIEEAGELKQTDRQPIINRLPVHGGYDI